MSNKGKKLKTKPRIEEKKPGLAERAMAAYALTRSARAAGRQTGLEMHTVQNITRRNPEEFTQIKNRLAAKCYAVSEAGLDEMMMRGTDHLSDMQLPITTGICIQRGNELTAREIPLMFDPQVARRVVEESEYWRKKLQATETIVTEEKVHAEDHGETQPEETGAQVHAQQSPNPPEAEFRGGTDVGVRPEVDEPKT